MKLLLRWKIFLICRGAKKAVAAKGVNCWVWWFGAYYINPKHLVIVVAVPTDTERDRLRSDQQLDASLKQVLQTYRWPEAARPHVGFDIESQETVARENNGNWWYHYK